VTLPYSYGCAFVVNNDWANVGDVGNNIVMSRSVAASPIGVPTHNAQRKMLTRFARATEPALLLSVAEPQGGSHEPVIDQGNPVERAVI
jgi:hypothetical protein